MRDFREVFTIRQGGRFEDKKENYFIYFNIGTAAGSTFFRYNREWLWA